MNKKYYFIFLIIPLYIFSGSLIDLLDGRNRIVNTLEIPSNKVESEMSDESSKIKNYPKIPVIKDTIKNSWLLYISYSNLQDLEEKLHSIGLEKVYNSTKKDKEILIGPFIDKAAAEYVKKKLENQFSLDISLKKITN
tara:strand:- start:43 stop:456 length:414 start_codon:yes stop_codon:yes gene_type:complete